MLLLPSLPLQSSSPPSLSTWRSSGGTRRFLRLLVLIATVVSSVAHAQLRKSHPVELTIKSGSIRGEYMTIGANDFAVFKGIPYAAPPVGSLRFQKPEEPASWRGVMNATQYPPMCAQFPRTRPTDPEHLYKIHISEDCLYLNVFAPPLFANDSSFPVVVWLHGGAFQSGSASDYPQESILNNFVSRKVVFITLNYRLGPMGFLSTGDEVLPGNAALWDILMALKWTNNNVATFGGDRSSILLAGYGAGASAASLLALSPRAEGLFSSLLLMSGTAISPGAVRATSSNATWSLDKKLHCRSFNSTELLDCFKKQLKDEILDTSRSLNDNYEERFVPTVDGGGGVVTEAPEILLSYRPKMPLMIGTTKDESALKLLLLERSDVNLTLIDRMSAEEMVENLTASYSGFTNHPLIAQGCKHEYVWSKIDPAANANDLYESMLSMYSHFWVCIKVYWRHSMFGFQQVFILVLHCAKWEQIFCQSYDAPTARLAAAYAEHAPVFLYSFDHVSENFATDRAFHGVEEIFLFDKEPRFLVTRKDRNWQIDKRVTEIFADMIVNFARSGHPTPESAALPFVWNQTRVETLDYLSITDSPTMRVGYRWSGHIFWNWYARHLDAVDVGNLQRIAILDKQLGDYQLATWMLLFCALFFFAILVALACYCTRKESDDDDL